MNNSRNFMFLFVGWTIVSAFIATVILTILALVNVVHLVDEKYLTKLFTILIVEIIASGFFIFKWGMNPSNTKTLTAEHLYFQRANAFIEEAQAAKAEGKMEEADRLLGEILRISVDDLPFDIRRVFRERGNLAFDMRLWSQAANAFGTYYEIAPDDLEALVRYGRTLRATNRYADALRIYERAEKLSPNNYDVLNGLQNMSRRMGGFFQEAGRPEVADGYFEKARTCISAMLKLAPEKNADEKRYLNAVMARARLYWQWERYPETIAAFKEIIDLFPKFIEAKQDLAAVLLEEAERRNRPQLVKEAHVIYQKLLDTTENDTDRVFIGAGLAEAVAMLKHPTKKELNEAEQAALGALSKLESAQEDPYPFYAIALLFKKKGENAEAEHYLEEAIRHERERSSDPYRFDYIRLVKYEKLLQRWTEFEQK